MVGGVDGAVPEMEVREEMARADVAARLARRNERACVYCDKAIADGDRYVVSEGKLVSGWCGAPSHTKGRLVTHKACWLQASLDGAIEDFRNGEAHTMQLAALDSKDMDLYAKIESFRGRFFLGAEGAANWAALLALGAGDLDPEACVHADATDAYRHGKPIPFSGGERCTYCSNRPIGYAELPRSGGLVPACHRHRHYHVQTFAACCLCLGRMTSKGIVIDGETHHKACYREACK